MYFPFMYSLLFFLSLYFDYGLVVPFSLRYLIFVNKFISRLATVITVLLYRYYCHRYYCIVNSSSFLVITIIIV